MRAGAGGRRERTGATGGTGAGLRRRKGDDRSRTASSVLTGAVRSAREKESTREGGGERVGGDNTGERVREGREKENEWRERCSEQRRRAHRNSRAIRTRAAEIVDAHDGGSTTSRGVAAS